MDTIEVQCTIHHNNQEKRQISDILVAQLAELGYYSFIDTDEGIKAYIEEKNFDHNDIICLPISPIFQDILEVNYRAIKNKNWNEEWEKNFSPVKINDQCIVRAPFHETDKNYPHEIIIEPKMSFGTGHHATTNLMIQELLPIKLKNLKILDIGCGTGILSILASQKNAKEIWAIDNDEWAYNNTTENIKKNNAEDVNVIHGDAKSIPKNLQFDLILANINRNILLKDIPAYAQHLKNKGTLIISGIYTNDLKKIIDKAKNHKLSLKHHNEQNSWIAARFIKNSS
ncbi:MAG: 50S ribosomal protein L11 methyltransferase [Bacteroidota bacterium]